MMRPTFLASLLVASLVGSAADAADRPEPLAGCEQAQKDAHKAWAAYAAQSDNQFFDNGRRLEDDEVADLITGDPDTMLRKVIDMSTHAGEDPAMMVPALRATEEAAHACTGVQVPVKLGTMTFALPYGWKASGMNKEDTSHATFYRGLSHSPSQYLEVTPLKAADAKRKDGLLAALEKNAAALAPASGEGATWKTTRCEELQAKGKRIGRIRGELGTGESMTSVTMYLVIAGDRAAYLMFSGSSLKATVALDEIAQSVQP